MARKKDEHLRAKTCIHAKKLTALGGLFVKDTCPNEEVIKLPTRTIKGIVRTDIRRPYIIKKKCMTCEFYKRRKK